MEFRFFAPFPAAPKDAISADPVASVPDMPVRSSLRTKGIVALVALVVYLVLVGLYLTHQRAKLLHIVQQMERVHDEVGLLMKVNAGLTHSVVVLQELLSAGNAAAREEEVTFDLGSFVPNLVVLKEKYPETERIVAPFEAKLADFNARPTSDNSLILLRNAEQDLAAKLEQFEDRANKQGESLLAKYRELDQSIALDVALLNLPGLAAFGATLIWFIYTLAADLRRLQERAVAVVKGYRGEPLVVTRHDEVGSLMSAINRMQSELDRSERQQEVSRLQRFHREKMAAIGSLAAAVAHEVSNPINAISGIAQYTIDAIQCHQQLETQVLRDNAELTLQQTERIGLIMRRLSDFSAPRSPDPQLINVNELVQAICSFIRFDRRFRNVDLVMDLDHELPAVCAVADHLTQILMNLLINAADALEGVAADDRQTVRVSTRRVSGEVIVSVSDNGHGMDTTVLAQAFDESFTTKPEGKGRGIGLYLCKTLIEATGGRIALESVQGTGTTAQVYLPTQNAGTVAGRTL